MIRINLLPVRELKAKVARRQEGEEGIHSIYLSGGSAKVPGLSSVLSEKLEVPVQLSDPFSGFTIARNIDRDYLSESALSLAVGVGLAIRRPGDK